MNIKYKIQLPVSLLRRIGFLLHFTSCLKVTSDSPNSRLINTQICGNLLYMQVNTKCLPDDSPTQILTVSATPCRVTGRNSICIHAPRPARAARARRTLVAKAYARNAHEDRIFAKLHKTAVQLSRPSADRGGSGSARLMYFFVQIQFLVYLFSFVFVRGLSKTEYYSINQTRKTNCEENNSPSFLQVLGTLGSDGSVTP